MSDFVVETHVPAPTQRRVPGRKAKYPFRAMKVGDSFTSPLKPPLSHWRIATPERRFVSRPEGNGWRTWRVA